MIPNELFIREVLDDCNGKRYITKQTAVILAVDKSLFKKIYIQTHTLSGELLDEPLLWNYDLWLTSQERWARQQKRAEDERNARAIFNANVDNLTRVILRVARVSDSQAGMIASKMVREDNWDGAKQLGLKKIVTDVKDI